jgi:hypothetical protein
MSALDELDEDPSFRLLKKYALQFMQDVEDSEAVREDIEAGETEAAYDHIDMPRDEAEVELTKFRELAEEVEEKHPDLVEQLRDEIDYCGIEVEPRVEDKASQ